MSYQTKILKAARGLAIIGAAWALTACGSSKHDTNLPNTGLGGLGGGGCITAGVQSQIAFTGSGIYVDSANVLGGRIPGSWQQFGTMTLGGGGAGQYNTRQGLVDGQLSMNINVPGQQAINYMGMNNGATNSQCAFGMCASNYYQPTNPYGAAPSNQATVTGSILLSEITKSNILATMGGYANNQPPVGVGYPAAGYNNGYNTGYANSQVCITGIAINSGRWDSGTYGKLLYDAKVYLYINGSTTNGYMLYF